MSRAMSVPRKLTDREFAFLDAPEKARLAYVEARLAEAERLLARCEVVLDDAKLVSLPSELRAFLAEVTHE